DRVPNIVANSVDLPTPFGPKTAMNSPGCTSKSSPDQRGSTAAWLKETNIYPNYLMLREIRGRSRLLRSNRRSSGCLGECHRLTQSGCIRLRRWCDSERSYQFESVGCRSAHLCHRL